MWLNSKSMLGVNCVTQVEGDGSHPVVEHRAFDGLVLGKQVPRYVLRQGTWQLGTE